MSENPGTERVSFEAWLVSVTTRLCIDRLRRPSVERAAYIGPWLPEPFIGDTKDRPEGSKTASCQGMALA